MRCAFGPRGSDRRVFPENTLHSIQKIRRARADPGPFAISELPVRKVVSADPVIGIPPAEQPGGTEHGKIPGEEENEMGWMMPFWVLLIVAVPTILWFLLAEKWRKP